MPIAEQIESIQTHVERRWRTRGLAPRLVNMPYMHAVDLPCLLALEHRCCRGFDRDSDAENKCLGLKFLVHDCKCFGDSPVGRLALGVVSCSSFRNASRTIRDDRTYTLARAREAHVSFCCYPAHAHM